MDSVALSGRDCHQDFVVLERLDQRTGAMSGGRELGRKAQPGCPDCDVILTMVPGASGVKSLGFNCALSCYHGPS